MIGKLFSGMGVGSLQFLTPTYVTEIAPSRIRGAVILSYSWWWVSLQQGIVSADLSGSPLAS
jgi:hypothetical protein